MFQKESRLNVVDNFGFRHSMYKNEDGITVAAMRVKMKFRKSGIAEHVETQFFVNHKLIHKGLQLSEDQIQKMILENL